MSPVMSTASPCNIHINPCNGNHIPSPGHRGGLGGRAGDASHHATEPDGRYPHATGGGCGLLPPPRETSSPLSGQDGPGRGGYGRLFIQHADDGKNARRYAKSAHRLRGRVGQSCPTNHTTIKAPIERFQISDAGFCEIRNHGETITKLLRVGHALSL